MSSNSPTRESSARRIGFAFLFALILTALSLQAQDAVRPSLAGEAAAEARRQTLDQIPYNLLAGPIRFRFSATQGVEFNDNINLSENDEQSDVILRPMINMNALWPVTQLNTLRIDLGLGYAYYIDHPENSTNSVLLAPGSQVSFDIFVSDFRINFHDRFSLEQDPIAEAQLSNVVDYGRFENTAGVSILWDLNKAVATLGYDHYNYISTTSQFDYLNRNADSVTGSLSIAATSTTGVGVEGAFVDNRYDQDFLNGSKTYSGGGFVETQLTNYVKVRLAGGYQHIDFDASTVHFGPFFVFQDRSSLNDYYFNALISHRINSAITQRLSLGHESQLGINSNYTVLNYIRHTATWNIINRTLLTTEFFYEDANDSGGFIDEHLHRYGGALSLGYQLTRHVTLGARYQYTQKDSDVPLRDYKQNRVSLDGTYSF